VCNHCDVHRKDVSVHHCDVCRKDVKGKDIDRIRFWILCLIV
jgi:hypothetical protein